MPYRLLHQDAAHCQCVKDLPDAATAQLYVRDFHLKQIPDKWFLSYWEEGKRSRTARQGGKCSDICAYKAVSVNEHGNLWQTRGFRNNLSPNTLKTRSHYCIFRVRGTNLAKIQPKTTPPGKNFFKSDQFIWSDHIEIVEVGEY